jgi:hypothetical protein
MITWRQTQEPFYSSTINVFFFFLRQPLRPFNILTNKYNDMLCMGNVTYTNNDSKN